MSDQEPRYPSDAWQLLSARLTEQRQEKMRRVAAARSKYLRLVVQDVHNPHNVSACLRSAEAFGVLNVDVVQKQKSRFKQSPVSRGVDHWLRVHRHTTIEGCAQDLRAQGFAIAAGMPRPGSLPLAELPLDRPLAVVFGNEHEGISSEWLPYLDYSFTIPMVGIVESLNISVCAAITLQHLTSKAVTQVPAERYHLNADEQHTLLCEWVCRQIRSWEGECDHLRRQLVKPRFASTQR